MTDENKLNGTNNFLHRLGVLALARMVCRNPGFEKELQKADYYFYQNKNNINDGEKAS